MAGPGTAATNPASPPGAPRFRCGDRRPRVAIAGAAKSAIDLCGFHAAGLTPDPTITPVPSPLRERGTGEGDHPSVARGLLTFCSGSPLELDRGRGARGGARLDRHRGYRSRGGDALHREPLQA